MTVQGQHYNKRPPIDTMFCILPLPLITLRHLADPLVIECMQFLVVFVIVAVLWSLQGSHCYEVQSRLHSLFTDTGPLYILLTALGKNPTWYLFNISPVIYAGTHMSRLQRTAYPVAIELKKHCMNVKSQKV